MRPNKFALLAVGLLVLASLSGCVGAPSATPTPGPSPTPAPVSFDQLDLTKVVLQASDLPGGYVLATQLSQPSDLEQVFGNNLALHAGLLAGQDVAYASGSRSSGIVQVYDNAIFVYSDTVQASQAFQSLANSFGGARIDFPELGSESIALHRETPVIGNPNLLSYTVAVVWRQDSGVVLLDSVGNQVPIQQMAQLAMTIQGRIVKK